MEPMRATLSRLPWIDAPAHGAEEPLPEEEPAADVEQQADEDGESEGCGRQADDDAQLLARQRELRAQQGQVGAGHAHERSAGLADGLTHAGGTVFARGCASGAASGRSGAGRTRNAGVRRGAVQGIRFERQGGPRFRVVAGSLHAPAARGYLSDQRPRG